MSQSHNFIYRKAYNHRGASPPLAPIPRHRRALYQRFDERLNNPSFWSVQRGANLFKRQCGRKGLILFLAEEIYKLPGLSLLNAACLANPFPTPIH